jgi:hypothetical protein
MTTLVNADFGVFNNAGAVSEWFDQAPSRVGMCWSTVIDSTTAATFNPAGFNGMATIDTLESPSQSQFQYSTGDILDRATFFVKPDEFTIAACLLYTGTKTYQTGQLNPIIWNATQNGGGDRDGCGLSVGIDPGNPNNVIFSVYANDSAGANPPKFAQSASVPKNVAHYVLGTLSGGVLSIYLDANAAVTTGGVGPVAVASLSSYTAQIAAGGGSTSQCLEGLIRAVVTYCVGQTAGEIAETLLYMKTTGGL